MHPTEIKRLFAYNYALILESEAKKGLDIDIQGVIGKAQKLTHKYVEGLHSTVKQLSQSESASGSPWDPRKQKYHYDESLEFCRAIGKAILGDNNDPFNVNPW